MKIHEINAITGIEQTRDATAQEIKEIEATQQDVNILRNKMLKENQDKAVLRETALAKLLALGLTEDEITAL